MKNPNCTRELAASTVRSYRLRIRQLAERCRRERSISSASETPPLVFIEWLISQKGDIGRNTWRQYKAAAVWSLKTASSGFWDECEATDRAQAVERLVAESQAGTLKKSTATSSRKAKVLPDDDLEVLERWFRKSRSRYATPIILILKAGRLTGLRPFEWARAEMRVPEQGDVCKLVVENGKATHGRAHGVFRTLRWTTLDENSLQMLIEWLDLVAEVVVGPNPRQAFENYLMGLRDELARATRVIWPRRKRHITLYSARHEAARRFKMHYPPEIVAALMGHSVDSTAYSHYSRPCAKSGKKPTDSIHGDLPLPDQIEVARVRKTGWPEKFVKFQQAHPSSGANASLTNK